MSESRNHSDRERNEGGAVAVGLAIIGTAMSAFWFILGFVAGRSW